MSDSDDAALALFCDILLPGNETFPAASVALPRIDDLRAALEDGDRAWLARNAPLAAGGVVAMADLEHREPQVFGRVLSALYTQYYTAISVQPVIAELAEAGPGEATTLFDRSLLDRVISTQAGKRRL